MADRKTRVVMRLQDRLRALLTITERATGDVYIAVRPKPGAGTTVAGSWLGDPTRPKQAFEGPPTGTPVLEYRFSIHPSPDSQSGSNTIKLSRAYKDGSRYTEVHYTSAIKDRKGCDPLFARIYPHLDETAFDFKDSKKDEMVDLGKAHESFTPIMMVCVAARGYRGLPADRSRDFRVKYLDFSGYTVVILWSFLTIPMLWSELWLYFHGERNVVRPGYPKKSIMLMFNAARKTMGDWYLDASHSFFPDLGIAANRGRFFFAPEADLKVAETWRLHSKKLSI